MWVTLDLSQAHHPWARGLVPQGSALSGSRDTSICQQRVTEAGTVSDRKTDTENSSEPWQETYKVEFLGNEQLDFPLGIYTAGKKGRTGIIWRWHYKRGNKLNTALGHGKATGIGMGVQQLGNAWLYISTPCTAEMETGKSSTQKNKPFPSLCHPLETANCATINLLFKGSARLGIWSSGSISWKGTQECWQSIRKLNFAPVSKYST